MLINQVFQHTQRHHNAHNDMYRTRWRKSTQSYSSALYICRFWFSKHSCAVVFEMQKGVDSLPVFSITPYRFDCVVVMPYMQFNIFLSWVINLTVNIGGRTNLFDYHLRPPSVRLKSNQTNFYDMDVNLSSLSIDKTSILRYVVVRLLSKTVGFGKFNVALNVPHFSES